MMVNRNNLKRLYSQIAEPTISVLIGARQVGKSTLLRAIQKQAESKGLKTRFYNLELSADLNALSGDQQSVFNELTQGVQVVFIDEFHYLPNAFKLFKAIFDSQLKVKIYASGSSSIEIHKHLKESLAGRFQKTNIYPLSWLEFKKVPRATFSGYCTWGGLPGLLHHKKPEAKLNLLENIVSTYVTKDIKGIIQEENIRAFNSLLYQLAQAQGQVAVVANLARETGLSESTLARHLEVMAQTFVCHAVPSYSGNLANELKKSKKYYLFDLGIRNHLLKDYRPFAERDDQGAILESFVYLQLLLQAKANMEIRFWRTKKGDEVDFIIVKNRMPLPIEVKSVLPELAVPKGLQSFLKKYPKAPYAVVYNLNLTGEIQFENRKVYFKKIIESAHLDYMQTVV